MSGALYIIATPIGNLEDITLRAVRMLKECDLIACEDTRQTKILLDHFQIQKPTISLFEHNESVRIPQILERLVSGQNVGVVSDAGTPTISDPAFKLVRAVRESGIKVIPIPGPTAAMAALCASGLPTDSFVFEGFLPQKKGRQTRWKKLAEEDRTIILYESPYRIIKMLEEIQEHLGERPVVLGRELTKIFEEFLTGTATELLSHFEKHPPKGEFVVMIAGKRYFERLQEKPGEGELE